MGDQEEVVESAGFSRRSFVKKLLAAGFAIPVVSSFALDASADASVGRHHDPGCHDFFSANQTCYAGNGSGGRGDCPICHYPHEPDDRCRGEFS